jgi:WD40 repeat protein
MTEPERPPTEQASDMPQHASPSGQASPPEEASPSGQAEGETVQTVKEAAFEPVPHAASAPPRAQSATGTSAREVMPQAVVRPRQPARQTDATPWLPQRLTTLLPRLALPAALLAIPIAAAFAMQIWLARTHVTYDGNLLLANGGMDEVTALHWSPTDGALYVGTRSGGLKSIGSNGSLIDMLDIGEAGASLLPMTNPVQSFLPWTRQANVGPIILLQDRENTVSAGLAQGFAITTSGGGVPRFDGGLFAAVEANNGSAVVGRAVTADSGQQLELPNNQFNAVNQIAPQQQAQQQQAQQQQIQPAGEQLKGEALQEPMPIYPQSNGVPRYNIALFRDFQAASATEVGQIFGIEDVRAVAALPGTNTVIAGDGAGNVFAIDASQQISGASPETYIRGVGQHETAIVEIAVAAQPNSDGVLFATRAEDRSIKVWRGGVSRASQLIPLGDYPSYDVTTPGSTWVRERIDDQGGWISILSMSADGSRVAGFGANDQMWVKLLDTGETVLPLDESEAFGPPMALSPDGSGLIAFNRNKQALEALAVFAPTSTGTRLATTFSAVTFTGLPAPIGSFSFDRTGQRFVAISGDGTVSIQNVATPDQAITLSQYQGPDIKAAISPDGSLVAVADASGQIIIHSAEDGIELTLFDGPQNLDRLVFDDSGRRLRVSTIDAARIYTYSLRNLRSTIFGPNLLAEAGRDGFIPNGNRVFSRNGDAGFRIIDIDSGATVGTLQGATGATGWVSNLDGSRIATLGGRGNISLFREEESPTANGPMPAMTDNALRLSADGSTLVVGGQGGELYLARLDGNAGEARYRLRRLALPAPALQYEISPDGASLVTAEADGTVSINDLTYVPSAAAVPADGAPTDGAEPAPTGGVTVAGTIEISGHGAPLTAMAMSPNGEQLATASLDGRLRITSIAWARLVHRIPLAELPSGPERETLEPQPLDESPYALMSGGGSSSFADGEPSGERFIIVYNARKSLGQARGARERAANAGLPDSLIYRRQGFFRGVFAFATAEARDEALPRILEVFSGAYARDLGTWCPNPSPAPNQDYIDCEAVLAGTAPPAMAN